MGGMMTEAPKSQALQPKLDEDAMLRGELAKLAKLDPQRERLRQLNSRVNDSNPRDGKEKEEPYAVGLALSGGGIRSACVSLGVMQKLAESGLLRHVDYLSTVSGGGYIGSALTWWLRRRKLAKGEAQPEIDTCENFPYGTTDPATPEPGGGNKRLQYLRTQGNYLAPGNGITLWSGMAITLRAIFLNLMVWIPVTALVMLLLLLAGRCPPLDGFPTLVHDRLPGVLETIAGWVRSDSSIPIVDTIPPVFLLALLLAAVLFLVFLLGSLGHSLLSWTENTEPPGSDKDGTENRSGQDGNSWGWILSIFVGLVGLLALGLTVAWVHPNIEPLFGKWPEGGPAAGLLPGGAWFGVVLWIVALAHATLCIKLCGPDSQYRQLNTVRKYQILVALLSLLVAIGLGIGLSGGADRAVWRVGLFLQFFFAVAFLLYLYYLSGLLIRHFLRGEATGASDAKKVAMTPMLLQYHARRMFEWFYGRALAFGLALTALGILPLVTHYIGFRLGGVWTALGLGITAAGQLWGRVAGHGRLTMALIVLGAILFAYSVMLVGYHLAFLALAADTTSTQTASIIAAMIAALVAGWFVNTNHIGLHRYYRDRLMEAFMPGDDQVKHERNDMAPEANEFRLSEAWPGLANGPYHIVNANVVLSNSDTRKYRLRGGANFLLSPFYVGSEATQWYESTKTDLRDLTLASAMAISGAAANPRGGAGGRGLTVNPVISLAMSLLNVRLGYWIPNPARRSKKPWFPARPNHFWPGGAYALGAPWSFGYREDATWLELADGGHFENLAVYELVRRRCGLIIVCDGGQDNASSYADLVTAAERVGADFNAELKFNMVVKDKDGKFQPSGPGQMIARPDNIDYPKGAEFAAKGYCVATIDYGDRGKDGWPESGVVIYLKSALIHALEIPAKGYRGANADFPNQTTGDQFFDEEQFDAYREVGYKICKQMIADLKLDKLCEKDVPKLAKLRRNDNFRTEA